MNCNLCEIQNNSLDFIKVWEEQYNEYINLLISEEKYEYCKLLKDNKEKLIIRGIFTSKNRSYEN